MIAGKQLTTRAWEEELIRIVQDDIKRSDRFEGLITTLKGLENIQGLDK